MDTAKPFGTVYTLVDLAEPDRVRYVGLTRKPLGSRLSGHWVDAQRYTRPVNNFLRKRLNRREEVLIAPLEVCFSEDELKACEIKWISHYRSLNQADLNLTGGGEGMFGYKMSDEQKQIKRDQMLGRFRGENFLGELKLSWDKVNKIRSDAVVKWESQAELGKRYGVSQSVIMKVLSNLSWIDEQFDPSKLQPRPPQTHANNRQIDESVVRAIRELRMNEWVPETEIARRYGLTRSNVNNILRGHRWPDSGYDPSKLVRAGGNGTGSKLTEDDVRAIRERCANGEIQRVVAADYGIEQTQVSRIVRGARWASVK